LSTRPIHHKCRGSMVYAYCFVSLGFLFGKCGLILTSLSAARAAGAGPAEAAEAPGLTTATSTMVFAKAQVYLPWPRAKAHIARARHYRYAGDIQNVKAFGKSPEASTMQDPWQSLGPACAFGFLGGLISWTWCSTRVHVFRDLQSSQKLHPTCFKTIHPVLTSPTSWT